MSLKVGNDMKFYYNSATDASPTWVLINEIGDLTVDFNINDAEVDLRVSNYLLGLPSKITGGFTLTIANNPGATVFDVLRAAALARTVQQYASADALIATNGTEYFKAFCHFTAFPWAQPTQEMSSHDATLSLSYHEEAGSIVEPAWVVVT